MTRFLHTSDWQLGMTRHYLSKRGDDDPQARFTADRIEAVRRLGDIARQEDCAFVVVAGDVFETHNVSAQIIARACEAIGTRQSGQAPSHDRDPQPRPRVRIRRRLPR